MRLRLFLLGLLLFPCPGGIPAQTRDDAVLDPGTSLGALSVDLWTEDDGLPQNMAAAIAQTPDGYLWLGMEEGLARFDGEAFRLYGPETTPAFRSPWVTSLVAAPDGTLWIGTRGGGLLRLRDGSFTAIREADGLADDQVQSLFRDRSGRLWVGTRGGGVTRLDEDGGLRTFDTTTGLSSDFVLSVGQDTAGTIWVGTEDGLNRIRDDEIRTLHRPEGLPGDGVGSVLGGSRGGLWVATVGGGLHHYVDGRFTPVTELAGASVRALHQDAAGTLWVGTNGQGLYRLADGEVSGLDAAAGMPGNLILSLATDREGGLWMGLTGAGLARLHDGLFTVLGAAEGLSAPIVLALVEEADGTAWVGTAGGGVNRIEGDRITSFTSEDGLAHDVVVSLAPADGGGVWVGTPGGGLNRIQAGVVETFGPETGLMESRFNDIAQMTDGALWLATPGRGLQRWDGTAAGDLVLTTDDGLPSDYLTALLVHSDGTLWAGTRDGLAWIRNGRVVRSVSMATPGTPGNAVTGLYEDPTGAVWVTSNQGLGRVRDGVASFYGPEIAAMDADFHAVRVDEFGFVWASTNHGILRFRPEDLEAVANGELDRLPQRRFGRPDGLRSEEANGGINPAALLRADGSLWFPTMDGVARVRPARSIPERAAPEPLVESVAAGDSILPRGRTPTLPPDRRSLEFRFTAPTFVAPEEVRFRYRLEGFDADWVDAGARRAAFYTNLPPGSYRFRVASRRADGAWREAETSLPVVLTPSFRETPAFFILLVLGLAGLAAAAYRLRVRTLQRRQRELVRLMEEGERTARALRASEERLRLALEAGRMGTWSWTPTTGVLDLSRPTVEGLGFDPRTFQELMDGLDPYLDPLDRQRLRGVSAQVEAGAETILLDLPLDTGPGHPSHVEIRGRVVVGEDARPDRVVGVVSDISEIMRTQAELRQRERELRQAQKMEAVGRLAGGVAHDFNNLLTTILGRTHFLLDSVGEGAQDREDLEEIRRSAERATNLTRQLLTFSRKEVLQPRTLVLNELIRGVDRMLRRLIREDVVLDTRLDQDLLPVHVDAGGIEQLLVNLVVNARDAMPDGGRVLIETTNGRRDGREGPATHVVLTVEDDGEGMSRDTAARAFEPFFTTKPVGKGTGLGLATVYGIVQQCHGQITLESEPGEGTRVRVYIPRAPAQAESELPVANDADGNDDGFQALRGSETILLVEDDDSVRSLVSRILERYGYSVVDCPSGVEALALFADGKDAFDFLLSDVVMPEIGGRVLAERVVAMRPEMRVLLMSGYNDDEVLRREIHESGMAFLAKPFEAAELVTRIRRLLDEDAAP